MISGKHKNEKGYVSVRNGERKCAQKYPQSSGNDSIEDKEDFSVYRKARTDT